jgi:hypothetical protein
MFVTVVVVVVIVLGGPWLATGTGYAQPAVSMAAATDAASGLDPYAMPLFMFIMQRGGALTARAAIEFSDLCFNAPIPATTQHHVRGRRSHMTHCASENAKASDVRHEYAPSHVAAECGPS